MQSLIAEEATISLTTAEITERLAEEAGSKAQAEQLAVKAGLVTQKELETGATIQVTEAALAEAIAKGKITASDANAIASALGMTGVNFSEAFSFETLGLAIKGATASLVTFLTTTPVGWAILAGTAIFAAVKAYDALTVSQEEALESLDKAKSEYDSTTSNLENLESELKTCTERLEELQKMADNGTISIVEQEELDKLKEQNDELEREIKLEQEKKKIAAQEEIDAAEDVVTSKKNSKYLEDRWVSGSGNVETVNPRKVTPQEELNASIDAYNKYKQELEKLQSDYDNGLVTDKDYKTQSKDLQDKINLAESRVTEQYEIIKKLADAYKDYEDAGGTLTPEQEQIKSSIEESTTAYYAYIDAINGTTASYKDLNKEQKKQKVQNTLTNRGLSEDEAKAVTGNMTDEELDNASEYKFNFEPPNKEDYANVEEYGKAYYNSWKSGWDKEESENPITNETNISSFEDIWNSSNFAKSREKLEKLAKSGELTSETLQSTDDYKKLLEETGLTADEVKNKIEEMVLSLTDSTSNIRNAITQFDDIYNQIKDGKAVDSDKLTGLDSSFGEINGGESLKEFKEVLTTMPGDIEASQKALDKLATEYIDQSGLIKNLNKDNKEWTKQELKKIGIINADEVVESRLSKITDEMAKKLKYCSKTIKDNEKAIRNHSEGSEEVISNVSNTIKEILGLSDLDFDLNFDSDFILENLNDIQEAANGSVEALDRLRVNSAKEIIANMHVEGDIQQEIYDLIDGLDLPNVEVGTGLDKTPFIKGLNDMIAAGKITANAVSSILSGMGVKATISTVTAPMKIASFAGYTRLPDGSLKEKLVTRTIEHAISAPQISYSSKGGGSTAHYSSPNPSSSGGSGGGGGGSSSEPQNTTYDWIEKKIKRVDEALSRLQKKESNVFSGWTDRTKALNDEISETSEKIKLMQDASKKYQEKANSIGLSQTYINRIQNGELRIEDVKDEKLKEKIEAYQEWYEKSVECSDQIQDLNIQLSEFAKQKFDNIVTQFENIQSVISAKSDLYNAYIDIATEQGRLVGKAYYSSLLDTEKSKKKSLEDELSKLKESLNSSVAEGRITVKSESWYELVGKINDVNAAILEADKNIVEFGNNIRQLKWDSFDLAQDKIGLVIDELQFVNDTLIASKKTIDGEGSDNGLTEYGKASLSTMSELYMIYTEQAKKYAIEANRIKSEEDMDDQNVIDRYNEMLEKQRESISNIQSQKDALIDLARNGYDAVLEAMQKTIDLKNKQLNSEKALYEYQKNIAEKSKNIALLEKQQAVYENDDSEEGKKRLQEIKVNLEKSKQDLKDTEYDKWLEQQQTMMDDLYNGYSDKIDEKFDNTDSLIKELIGVSSDSNKLIQEIANAFGYQLSGETVGINSLNDVSTMIANIVQAVANRVANANNSANTNIELVNGKIQGFASGGIVGDLQKVAYGNGDDAITINTLKKGEAIMTPDETIQFKKLIDNLVPLNSIIDNAMIKNVIPNKNAISNQSVNFVIEKIELENVNNPNEFVKGLSTAFKSPEVIKMVQTISTDVMLGKSIKNINKF